jgi:cytochrome b561
MVAYTCRMQPELNASKRYNTVSIILHWVLGAALIAIFIFGTYMADLPFSPQRLKLFNWHKWAGISILVLSALRLIWRLSHPAPALPAKIELAMPGWQLRAHQLTHIALYALFFVVPLIGWAYTSAAGFPVVLFGVFPLPDLVSPDKGLAQTLKSLHKLGAFSLAGLVLLHIAAALKHQFIDRDGLLQRMSLRG